MVAALVAATDKTFQALASQTSVGEDPTEINTPAMSLSAVKKLPSEVAGSGLNVGSGKFGLPMTSTGNATDDSPVDMKVMPRGPWKGLKCGMNKRCKSNHRDHI